MRSSSSVNCQSMDDFLLSRARCHFSTSDLIVFILSILRFRHCLFNTLNSISQMFSQLPCAGGKVQFQAIRQSFEVLLVMVYVDP
jgi:hypothetical protein